MVSVLRVINNFSMVNIISKLSDELAATSLVVALGSNSDSERSFKIASAELSKLGTIQRSSLIVGRDYTGQTQDIYYNACVYLVLDSPWLMQKLHDVLKYIERSCGRHKGEKTVPMDLDILAISDGQRWHISQKRLPFKEHERVGLAEVAEFLLDD